MKINKYKEKYDFVFSPKFIIFSKVTRKTLLPTGHRSQNQRATQRLIRLKAGKMGFRRIYLTNPAYDPFVFSLEI